MLHPNVAIECVSSTAAVKTHKEDNDPLQGKAGTAVLAAPATEVVVSKCL